MDARTKEWARTSPGAAHAWLAGASVVLVGCLGDALVSFPLDPDATTTSMGGVGTEETDSIGDPTSGLDSNSGSGQVLSVSDDATTSMEPCDGVVCPPDEVCIGGLCFECPTPPACNPRCDEGEACQCPADDLCCDVGTCLPVACPLPPIAGNYDPCLDPTGMLSDEPCAGATCVADAVSNATAGVCVPTGCDTICQCPAAPIGDAEVTCEDVTGDGINDCWLECESDETCPDGMICFGGFICLFPVPSTPEPTTAPGYGDCADNPAVTCLADEDACFVSPDGTAAACTHAPCGDALECPTAPPTGDAEVTCGNLGAGNICYLDCADGQTCPDGTVCTAVGMGTACLWPDDGLLLDESFELGVLRPGWMVIDVDGNVPAMEVSFVSDAWVVTDEFEPGVNHGAYSTSWYAPAAQADDWLVTPQIMLGPASTLSWEAWAPDVTFADGYEVRVSTDMPTVMSFLANPPLFTIANEADTFTPHAVDLAAAGYASQAVYLAFRNDSLDDFVLVIDEVQVTE